jgi:transposase
MRFEEAPMVGRSTVAVTAESQAQLQALAGSHERGEADRARAILLTLAGWSSGRIGEAFGVREDTVRLWRMRFMQGGVAGLRTHSPPGASPVKAKAALAVAEEVLSVPVANRTNWTLRRLAAQIEQRAGLRISASRLSVVLRKKGISVGAAPGTR